MAVSVKRLVSQLRGLPRAFRIVAAVAVVDVVILIIGFLSLEVDVDDQATQITELKTQVAAQKQKVGTTRKEISRLPELRRLYDSAVADGLLAEPDRLKLVDRVHTMSDRYNLSDLHYKLTAEQVTPIAKSKFQLVATPVAFESVALLDTDVISFWQELLDGLQAHYQITKAVLERRNVDTNTVLELFAAGKPAALVTSELDFEWLSLRKNPEPGKTAETKAPPQPAATAATAAATPAEGTDQ